MARNDNYQIKMIDNSCEKYKDVYKTGYSKFDKIGNWLNKESNIFKSEASQEVKNKPNFKRGQIIKIDFGINIGSELSNTHFAIVLNNDDNNSVDNITVIPITSKKGYMRLEVGNILKDFEKELKATCNSYVLLTQITTISKRRIINTKIKSYCDKDLMNNICTKINDYLTK